MAEEFEKTEEVLGQSDVFLGTQDTRQEGFELEVNLVLLLTKVEPVVEVSLSDESEQLEDQRMTFGRTRIRTIIVGVGNTGLD